jgi:Xaa-Pro aminopeptidase/Xaa-Pro dipeptidase
LHEKISKALPDKTRFEPSPPLIEEMRATKDKTEIARIRKSVEIARKSYKACIPKIRAGIEERELAMEIEFLMRKEGAEESAFDTICASGKNSSLPHAKAGRRKIIEGDTVIIDFGAKFKGYNSDITRTHILGKPKKEVEEIFELLKRLVSETIKVAKRGMCASDLDGIARTKIEREGYGSYFLHGLGHGIGLDVHEKPNISATSKDKINPGMVFTIEPGIYIEGKFGIRIEEMLLMRESTPLLLTKGF